MDKPAGYAVFATLLSKREVEQLARDAEAIEELIAHPGWAAVEGLIRERVARITEEMRHQPLSHLDYAWKHAMCSGLEQALCAPEAVLYAGEQRLREEKRAVEMAAQESR